MKKISQILRQALRKSAQHLTEEKNLLTEQPTGLLYGPGYDEWCCGLGYSTLCGVWDPVGNINTGGVLYDGHPGCIPNSATPYFCGASTGGSCSNNNTKCGIKPDHIMPNGNTAVDHLGLNAMPTVYTSNPNAGGVTNCIRPFAFNSNFCPIDAAMSQTNVSDVCHLDNLLIFPSVHPWSQTSSPTTANQMFVTSNIYPQAGSNPWLVQFHSVLGGSAYNPSFNNPTSAYCIDAFGAAQCEDYNNILSNQQQNIFGASSNVSCGGGWSSTNSPCQDLTCAGTNITPCQFGNPNVTQLTTYNCQQGTLGNDCVDPGNGQGQYTGATALEDCATSVSCQKYECQSGVGGNSLCEPCDYTTQYDMVNQIWGGNCTLDDQCTGAVCDVNLGCTIAGHTFSDPCDPLSPANTTWPNWYDNPSTGAPYNGEDFTWTGPTVTGLPAQFQVNSITSGDIVAGYHLAFLLVNGHSYCEWCNDAANAGGNTSVLTDSTQFWHTLLPSGQMVPWTPSNPIEKDCCCCDPYLLPNQTNPQLSMAQPPGPTLPVKVKDPKIKGCDQLKKHVDITYSNWPTGPLDVIHFCEKCMDGSITDIKCECCDNLDQLQEGVTIKGKLLNKLRMVKLAGIKKK